MIWQQNGARHENSIVIKTVKYLVFFKVILFGLNQGRPQDDLIDIPGRPDVTLGRLGRWDDR